DRLVRVLEGGARRPAWYRRDYAQAAIFPVALLAGGAVAAVLFLMHGLAALLLALGIGVVGLGPVVLWYLTPDLEIISENGRTRASRFRGWVGAAVTAVVLDV